MIQLRVREIIEQYQAGFPAQERPTQTEIAVQAGINPSTLSHYVAGHAKRPDLTVLGKLCVHLGVKDMNEMFVLVEEEQT